MSLRNSPREIESLRSKLLEMVMDMKTSQELEAALLSMMSVQMDEVIGHEENGTSVTRRDLILQMEHDWSDLQGGKAHSHAEMKDRAKSELGIDVAG